MSVLQEMIKTKTISAPKRILRRVQESYKNADGLGDMVADAIKVTTGKEASDDCNCAKRKAVLNKWVPFHKRK